MGVPPLEDEFEGVLAGQFDRRTLLLAVGKGIDALGDQRTGFVTQDASLTQ